MAPTGGDVLAPVSEGPLVAPLRDREPPRQGLSRVMLVDDHPLWRETLRKVIERQAAGDVVAEVDDGEAALAAVRDVSPDIVVMDLELPGMDGVATTERIVTAMPDVKVLFLSSFDDRSRVLSAVEAGASGYLLKTVGASEVADAVRRVAAGELVFPPHLAEALLAELRDPGREDRTASEATSAETTGPEGVTGTFRREGEFWTLEFQGDVARVADLNGLVDLSQLLAVPGREVLAVELVAAREAEPAQVRPNAPEQDQLRPNSGSGVGPALDATAKRAYRRRIQQLQTTIEEAEGFGDTERASRARGELQLLTDELSKAVGLAGRDRPVGSDVERARVSVTRGIRRAIRRIDEALPVLGRHLDRSVRTGTFCSYDPEVPVDWTLS